MALKAIHRPLPRRHQVAGRVSFIIPCFNGERFIAEAIDSALRQTWPDVEVIVVDDGSSDGSADIMRSYAERIRVVRQENRGLPAARNSGIAACTGEFLCFLDADDLVSPEFAAVMAQSLVDSDATIAYCGWCNVGAADRSNEPHVPPDFEKDGKVDGLLAAATPWPVHAALIRASVVAEIGGFDEWLPTCEDYDFWLRAALTRKIIRVPKVMAVYRHHDQQMSTNRWRQAYYSWAIKSRFVEGHPEIFGHLNRAGVRKLVNGSLHRRGFEAFWRRDLASAQRIFRLLFWTGYWSARDLRYLLPALLPSFAFRRLVKRADQRF